MRFTSVTLPVILLAVGCGTQTMGPVTFDEEWSTAPHPTRTIAAPVESPLPMGGEYRYEPLPTHELDTPEENAALEVSLLQPQLPPIWRFPGPPGSASWRWPLEDFTFIRGMISARRGRRAHRGLDLAAPRGTPIRAAKGGRVVDTGRSDLGYGRWVVIDHGDGLTSIYGHCSRELVRPGEWVETGQVIAEVGATGNATGPHVHFEIREGEQRLDPVDHLPPR